MSDPIVGIDLGTSNTVVAYAAETGAVSTLADDQNYKICPSVVSFHPNGGIVVGAAAKQRKVIDPKNTIYSIKRLIGRSYNSTEVQTAKTRVPFVIKEGPNQQPIVGTRGGEFAVPEISAIVLDHVRNVAATSIGKPVNRAVVTVPASFNETQRSATATAGAIAGLTVVRVLNEPTAAALAYGNTRNLREVIAVFDFGGGTFDITILKLEDQVYEVLGTAGDTFLGGDDLDERLVDRMVEKFLLENRIDLRTNEVAMMRLRAVAEQTKIELSRRSRAVVRIDEIAYGAKGKPLDLQIEISRDEFVRQCADIIDRTFPVCQEALNYASLTVDKIDDVILVGGTTKIPYVRDQVARFFAHAPRTDVNPEEAVAVGAALQATSLERVLGRKSPVVTVQDDTQSVPATTVVADLEDTTATAPAEYPLPQARRGDEEELQLVPPRGQRRPTAGYAQVRRTPSENTERPVTRGEHHDTFGERTPPPPAAVALGRLTKTFVSPSSAEAPPVARSLPPALTPPSSATLLGTELRTSGRSSGAAAAPGAPSSTTTPARGTRAASPTPTPTSARAPTPTPTPAPTSARAASPTPASPRPAPASIPPPFTPASPAPTSRAPTVGPPPLDPATAAWLDGGDSTVREPEPQAQPARRMPEPQTQPTIRASNVRPQPPTRQAPTLIGEPPQPSTRPAQAPTLIGEPPRLPQAPPPPSAEPPRPPARSQTPTGASTLTFDLESDPRVTSRGIAAADLDHTVRGMTPAAATAKGFAAFAATPMAPVVVDVTPRGLGIGTVAGYCEELIRRNARVPAEVRKLFTTSRDGQESVRIIVCQGESRRLDSNVVIGDLVLQGISPRPRGEVTIEVTFMLDASGILQVRARDAQTGREQRASLDLVGAMPQQEVDASRERMQQLRR